MTFNTKNFGEITVADEDIITFDEGLPGFLDKKRFAVVYDDAEGDNLFVWLQSVEDEDLCFVLVDAAAVLPWYRPSFEEAELEGLDIEDPADTLIYNIARFPEDIHEATTNLLAPVVINAGGKKAKKGKQVVAVGGDYGVRHYLFKKEDGKGAL